MLARRAGGPWTSDPLQDVRVTEHGECYHVVSGKCKFCPKERSTVVTLQMARAHLMKQRACTACNVADQITQNMIPTYLADGTRNPRFPTT